MKKLAFMLVLSLCSFVFAGDEEQVVKVKEIEPFLYCAVEMTGSYEQHPEAFQTLYEQAGIQGLGTDMSTFGIYHNDPSQVPEAELKWEVGFKLEEEAELEAPLVLKKWEHKLLAAIDYEGSFSGEALGLAFQKLFPWVGKNGYTPSGPTMEKFTDMPTQNSDGEWEGKVVILLPVVKK